MQKADSFDYVIVGAGSAGCVLAARLSASPGIRVLLLEAGPMDRSIVIHMPAACPYLVTGHRYNWAYESEPEPHLDDRRIPVTRGRVLGGTSAINGMTWVRGHPLDYNRWAEDTGLEHWDYAHVLPYFKRSETGPRGADAYRGGDGPMRISTGAITNPLMQAFLHAAVEVGYGLSEDLNGFQQEGFGRVDGNIHRGRRWSTAVGYLRPARRRRTLMVKTGLQVTRVLFEGGRVVGVEYRSRGGRRQVRAEREVVLAAGAVDSPKLLMLSGIGDGDALRRHGILVRHALPAVGRNLEDHLQIIISTACREPVTLYGALQPWSRLRVGLQWLFFQSGLGASNHFEVGGFVRTEIGLRQPDLQFQFLPLAHTRTKPPFADLHGYQAHAGPLRLESRGRVWLRSADPFTPPRVQFTYLASEGDRRQLRKAVSLAREILQGKAFDPYRGEELSPGPDVQTDTEVDAFVRAHVTSRFHLSSTCRMGQGADAVVDSEGRVHGLEGLRVVDASIMPSTISGNLNAPVVMMAEKIADAMLGLPALTPLDVPVYVPSTAC